ncbi:MAG: M15 family metallopeptidase [Bacteroidales bacterium]
MNFKFGALSIERLAGVDTRLVELMQQALAHSPVDFGIAYMGGLRTAHEQNELYRKGATKIDGYSKISKHQVGKAIDVLPYINGKPNTSNINAYCIIAGVVLAIAHLKGLDIVWGGTFGAGGAEWNGWDKPHFEIR